MNVADLRSMPERLSADSGVRQGPTDRQVQVIRPRFRRQAVFQALLQDIDPELSGRDVHGMAVASGRHREPRGRPHLPDVLHRGGYVCDSLRMEDGLREEMNLPPEIPRCEFVPFEAEMPFHLKRLQQWWETEAYSDPANYQQNYESHLSLPLRRKTGREGGR